MSDNSARMGEALLDLRACIEQAGGKATGTKIVVPDRDTLLVIQHALGGLMSTPNSETFMALGFGFELPRQHSAA